MDSAQAAHDLTRKLLEADLHFVWLVHCSLYNSPLHNFLAKVVSANPLHDISLATWSVFLAYLYDYGPPFFYACAFNLIFASALRFAIQAKRPFEFSPNLRPLTDRHPTSYGFPSLESYMAVVVYGLVVYKTRSPVLLLLLTILTTFIGITRLYACSRFAYQIVGSWVLGLLGLQIAATYWSKLEGAPIAPGTHTLAIAVTVLALVCYVAIHAESNESYLLKLPKQEYTRVLTDILQQDLLDSTQAHDKDEEELPEGGGGPQQRLQQRKKNRKDSFYFLERVFARRKGIPAPDDHVDVKRVGWKDEGGGVARWGGRASTSSTTTAKGIDDVLWDLLAPTSKA